jgi:hypothetical protein
MQFLTLASFLSTAALVAGNSVTFQAQDSTTRTIYFTSNPGSALIDSVVVPGSGTAKVNFPHGWQGNWYSVSDGAENKPGMLGEVAFNSWNDITYFDVSAIVDPTDKNGVKKMYPVSTTKASMTNTLVTSGCDSFPCANAYYLPDDVQTKATHETDLICTLGTSSTAARAPEELDTSSPAFSREWVMGKWTPQAN